MKRAIIIMTKVPIAGTVKTRLQPILSPDQCAALAKAFLLDAASKSKTVCENVILAYSPPEELNFLRELLPAQKVFAEQTGEDLGQRMFNAFQFAFAQKPDSVVMIGTDSPTFPAEFIEQSFELLETDSDAVLGKTADGGFYLIGLRVLRKEIFANVCWSSPQTFKQTHENIINLNLRLSETSEWYDVDTPPDFKRLQKEFLTNENIRRRAPETFEVLKLWKKF